MPQIYGTEKLVKFSNKLLRRVYAESVFDKIVNRNYEGEVKDASIVKIPSLAALSWKTYAGSVAYDEVNEIVDQFLVDQKKYNAFKFKDITKWEAFIKDPKGPTMDMLVEEFKLMVDTYVLGFHSDVAAGQWVGTDYTTGTVTVDVTTGAVTGSGTTFTSAMVGKPFKAAGHTQWYRVKTYTSGTSIVIEDDLDAVASQYSGGAIASGSSYVIQANTALTFSVANAYATLLKLREVLNKAHVPMVNRWVVFPPEFETLLMQADILTPYTDEAFEMVKRGGIGYIASFNIMISDRVTGDNTTGFNILAGTTEWLTFADGLAEGPEEIRLESDFATGYRELRVYGAKVADERRKFAVKLFAKV